MGAMIHIWRSELGMIPSVHFWVHVLQRLRKHLLPTSRLWRARLL